MAMAALSGFHRLIREEQQVFPGRKKSDIQEILASLAVRRGNGGAQCVRQVSRKAAAAMIGPGNSATKAGRGEAGMAHRDQAAPRALAYAAPERVAARGAASLEVVSGAASHRREWSPAGDSATSSQRSRLESQWTMSLRNGIDKDLTELELYGLREGECEGIEEANSTRASSSQVVEEKAVSSGRPKARSRRLAARTKRMSTAEKRIPIGAFTIFPRKGSGGKSNHRKVEAVQNNVSTYLREISKIDRLTAREEVMLSKIIRVGHLMREQRKKLESAVGHELSKHQWADLIHMKVAELDRKLHESELARDRLVMANLRLVVSVVKQYKCEGLEVADLIQEGTIGLLKGVDKFDHTRGYKLSTYIHWWIRQGVTRAIADHSRTVRLPVHVHYALGRIRRARARMLQYGDRANVETLGETLNLSNNQVMTALKVSKRLKSLDMQVGHQRNFLSCDSETFHGLIGDQHDENQPWTMVERAQLKGDVLNILRTHLGSREQEIIKMHFGVDSEDGHPMSLEKISHRYGISRERVRQLERAARHKLQQRGMALTSIIPC